jgi:type IV pilus assembly protein PilA
MPRNGERGFTLVELLVVILIIGILAAIAVPAFLNQRAKGQDAQAKSAAAVAAEAFEIYHQDHHGYADATAAALIDVEPSLRQARALDVEGLADGYRLSVESKSGDAGGGPFRIERSDDDVVRSCDQPGLGGCPESGLW